MFALMFYITLNRPIVMCFDIQSTFKKFTTNAKTSCALLLGVHKSKLTITQTYFTKNGKTYVFSFQPNSVTFHD
jgi:hypothetical protein